MTITAAAICAAFTSCSHDFETPSQEEIDQLKAKEAFAKYENAFIAAFGQPAATQDWGFGSLPSEVRTRGGLGQLPAQPSFRSEPSTPTFNTTRPNGIPKATETTLQDNGVYYIDNSFSGNSLDNPQNRTNMTIYADGTDVKYSHQSNQNNLGTTIIVTENSTLTLGIVENCLSIYLAPGATLNLPEGATFKKRYAMLYMSNGSTVNVAGNHNVTFAEQYRIINEGGTFNSNTNLTVREAALMYNKHDITVNTLNIEDCYTEDQVPQGGEVVNLATINATNVNMKAGGKFHNVGTVTVSNKTYITNDDTTQWENDGQYTTGEFYLYDCNRIYNNCKLTVTRTGTTGNGTFTLAESEFVLNGGDDAGASVICDAFVWEKNAGGQFHMGSKSQLKVNGTMLMKNENYNYGFHGYGTSYAVIQATKVEKDAEKQYKAWYDGKLYIATNDHFAQGGNAGQPWIYIGSDVIFKGEGTTCPVTIASTNCNPGYNEDGPKATLRVMAEDLSATDKSDFDFNDVVFDVAVNANKTAAKIILRAAGGTLPLKINSLNGEGGWEVHDAFKVPRNTMVNTNAKAKGLTGEDNLAPVELGTITDDFSAANIGNAVKNIRVEVYKNGSWMELEAKTGVACCKFACSPNNDWVKERNNIDDFYTFSEWVQGFEATLTKRGNW